MNLNLYNTAIYSEALSSLPNKKLLINTINAHSYNVAQKDSFFAEVLQKSDILLPDGISIVLATRLLKKKRIQRIAGADLFYFEMNRLNKSSGKCFFLGSNTITLKKIEKIAKKEFSNVQISSFAPPFKKEFTDTENMHMISLVNSFQPDVLFIGMTAPKQEKWAFTHFNELNTKHVCSIGAVFDFYAGNIKRAPHWMQLIGLEWFYRLLAEPRRMWKRYLIGNIIFLFNILKEIVSTR